MVPTFWATLHAARGLKSRLSPAALAWVAALLGAGCDGSTQLGQMLDAGGGTGGGGAPGDGGAATDAPSSDAGPGCGAGYPIGSSRPAGDGCNSCLCLAGPAWVCSTISCPPDDASTPADAPADGGGRAGSGGGSGGAGGGSAGTGGRGGAGGGQASCRAAEMLDRTCTSATDCVAVGHIVDCCGTGRMMGLRATEQSRFRELEAQCVASYPGCECPPQPTLTDDGSAVRTSTTVGVACRAGVCTTFHSACGQPCSDGRVCITCANGPSTYAVCTTSCERGAACADPALPLCQSASSGDRTGMYCTAAGVACGTPR
jgi:hypothetical protein